jgi:thiamine phosphate synthase YjbQ (UPF0047 family)
MQMHKFYSISPIYIYPDSERIKVETSAGMQLSSEGIEKVVGRELTEAEREILGKTRIVDLTDILEERVAQYRRELGLSNGILFLYDTHTTTAVRINEMEQGILERLLGTLFIENPADEYFPHDDFEIRPDVLPDERKNGWAHHVIMRYCWGRTTPLPILNGELALGRWQHVMWLDFDAVPPQIRELSLTLFYGRNTSE